MKIVYRKSVSIIILILAISMLLYSVFLGIDAFWNPERNIGTSFLAFFLATGIFLVDGVALLRLYYLYKKETLDIQKSGKFFGILGLSSTVVIFAWGVTTSFAFNNSIMEWPYFTSIILTLIILGLCIAFMNITKKDNFEEYSGFSIYRNHCRFLMFIIVFHLINYVLSLVKVIVLYSMLEATDEAEYELFAGIYFYIILATLIIAAIVTLAVLYLGFVQFISGKENVPMELKRGLPTTMRLLAKYEVGFWFGNAFSVIFGVAALVSAIQFSNAYYSLAVLYGILLLINVPTFFWRQHIETKYKGDDYKIYKEKHRITIYIGINLLILGIIELLVGTGSVTKLDSNNTAFSVYAIFVPYAIIRLVIGIIGFIKSKKTGDPYRRSASYLSIMIALLVLSNTAYMISGLFKADGDQASEVWYTIATVITYVMAGYVTAISVITIIFGILGLNGKFQKQFEKHQEYLKKINIFRFESIVVGIDEKNE